MAYELFVKILKRANELDQNAYLYIDSRVDIQNFCKN